MVVFLGGVIFSKTPLRLQKRRWCDRETCGVWPGQRVPASFRNEQIWESVPLLHIAGGRRFLRPPRTARCLLGSGASLCRKELVWRPPRQGPRMGPLQTQTKTQTRQPRPRPGMAVDLQAAAAAGTPYGFPVRLLILVFGLPLLTAESLKVEMAGETQTVLLNHNATISCKVLGSSYSNITNMGVIWVWKNPVDGTDVKVFEFYADHQKAFRPGASVSLQGLAKGDASLQLPAVQLWEAGEYRCKVVNTPDGGQGTVVLKVIASPHISLSVKKAKEKDNDDQRFLCKATGFYPKSINITWCKWSQDNSQCLKISENVTTNAAIENEDNTFNVTSSLRPEHNATYQCIVEHTFLGTPWRRNITLPENGSETKSDSWNPLCIAAVCLVVLVPIIAAIFLWKRLLLFRNCCRKQTLNKKFILIALDSQVV